MTEYERLTLAISMVNALNSGVMDDNLRNALIAKCLELLGQPSQKTTVEKSA